MKIQLIKITIFTFFTVLCINVLGQSFPVYTPTTIYTPKPTAVAAKLLTSGEMTQNEKNNSKNFWLNYYENRITYLAEATHKYNCHAYAWHVSEGGNLVCLDTPGDDEYWDDCSYLEVSSQSQATKVSFGGPCVYYSQEFNATADWCDHSAITTSVTDEFISKWGSAPRFRHSKNDCPYDPQDLHFYVRPSFSGPSIVCTSNSTFTLHNRPPGTTVNWTKNPYLVYVSGQGTNNYTVKAHSSASDPSWVKATISSNCGNTVIQEDVWAGTPYFFHIRLVDWNTGYPIYELCRGEDNFIEAEYTGSSLAGVDNNWDWQSSEFYIGFPLYPDKSTGWTQPYGSYGTIHMKAHNQCGYSDQNSFGLYVVDCGGWFFGMHPNPANDYVNIVATKNDKAENTSEYYEVKIYNNLKVTVYETGKKNEPLLRINTNQFLNGIYFVHFITGKQSEVKQLIVNH